MIPKRIILVRHGRSAEDDNLVVYGQLPDYRIDLVEQGFEQAQAVGGHIHKMIGEESYGVYISPYLRAVHTWNCIKDRLARKPVFCYQEPCLRGQNCGDILASLDAESLCENREHLSLFFYRCPNGESCADVYDRTSVFINSLYRLFVRVDCPENLIIVTHSVTMRCFLACWYHWTVDFFDSLPYLPNGHIVVMTRGAKNIFTLSEPFANRRYFSEGG